MERVESPDPESDGGDLTWLLSDPPIYLRLRHGPVLDAGGRWAWIRHRLAEEIGEGTALAPIRHGPQGKPELEPPQDWLRFSVSHRPGLLLLGIGRQHRVGVDLEPVEPARGWMAVARTFFAPGEVRCLASMAPDRAMAAFYAAWVIKEAALKAAGCGIGQGLAYPRVGADALECLADAGQRTVLLRCRLGKLAVLEPVGVSSTHGRHPVKMAAAMLTTGDMRRLQREILTLA